MLYTVLDIWSLKVDGQIDDADDAAYAGSVI